MSVGSFGVGPWNLKQGALLTNYDNVHYLSNVEAVSRSQNQEIGLGHLVQVDWSAEEVVFKRLKEKDKPSQRDNKTVTLHIFT